MNSRQQYARAVLATLADFGSKRNLKTPNSLAIVGALLKLTPNTSVLCRDYKRFDVPAVKMMPLGNIVPKAMSFASRYYPKTFGRFPQCIVLDFFAQHRVPTTDLLLVYPPHFHKVAHKVKRGGGTVVLIDDVLLGQGSLPTQEKPIGDRKYRTYSEADYSITFSEFSRKFTMERWARGPDRVFAVPTGTDTARFRPGRKADDVFRVLAVGHYSASKGFQHLMEAWEQLELPNSELVVVGRPRADMRPVVERFHQRLKNFRTTVTSDPLPFYQQASVLVHPSWAEGSARVIFEAMACGLPVVCTPESGSVIEDGVDGFLIPARDPEAIVEKLRLLHADPRRARALGEKGLTKVRRDYDWSGFEQRLLEVLREIARREGLACRED